MRRTVAFGALVMAQAAHSVEEYIGRLWDSFPPAHFLTGLVSPDREWSFIALTILLMAFGLWVIVEAINGITHPVWTLHEGGYTPGVATAPLLLALAVYLGYQLRNDGPSFENR